MTARRVVIVVIALAALLMGAPVLLLQHLVTEARDCFARVEQPRGVALPDCAAKARWLDPLSALPWLGRPAQRCREELTVRMAVLAYCDAAIGHPDRGALHDRFAALARAQRLVEEGSKRRRLDELGPPMATPEPGALAQRVGDRATLVTQGERWRGHSLQGHAIQAALLETDVKRAVDLARRYRETDHDELLVQLSALWCIGGDWEQGMTQAAAVEKERAEHRTANFSVNFGAARVVVEACAAGGQLTPPVGPSYGHAGQLDQQARLGAMRMGQLRRARPCDGSGDGARCWERPAVAEQLEHLRMLLLSEDAQPYRLELLATVAESVSDPTDLLKLFPSPPSARVFAHQVPLLADRWVDRQVAKPLVPPARFAAAARHLEALALGVEGGGKDQRVAALRSLAVAMGVEAAVGYALQGDGQPADLGAAGLTELGRGPWGSLMRANVALLGGHRDRALVQLEGLTAEPTAEAAAAWLTRAELSLPDRSQALAAAEQARVAARAAGDVALVERVAWLLVSLGEPPARSQDAPLPRVPWVGQASALIAPSAREHALAQQLGQWHRWLGQPAEQRRAARYALSRGRGDAPKALVAYLYAAGQLVDEPSEVEPWLDAVMAQDAGRMTLSSYALARWRAAAWRGDESAAATWRKRFATLSRLAAMPKTAELFQQLGL